MMKNTIFEGKHEWMKKITQNILAKMGQTLQV